MRRRPSRDDAGVTLAETLVVMMLMGLVGALVLSFTLTVQGKVSSSQVMNDNTNQAAAATNEITRLLRGAVPLQVKGQPQGSPSFVEAGPTSVTFYTVVDTDPMITPPILVNLEVTPAGNLVEKRWHVQPGSASPYWTFPPTTQTPTSTRTVAHGMTATPGSGKVLFTYRSFDTDGNDVLIGSGPLTKEQRFAVGAVQVDAEAQTGARATPTLVTTIVGLRNLPAGSHGAH